ncbi:MAG: Ig-like domain-containing protein [Bacilli bacterium]
MNRKKVIIRTCSALIALGLVVSCSNKASSSSTSTTPSSSSTPTSSSSTTSPVVQKALASISLKNEPTKVEYNLNEALDLTGASIVANYSDGTSETVIVTDKMITSVDMSSAGSKVVTVSYTVGSVTKTATFTIKVVDNSLKISAVDFTSDVATVRVGSSFTLEAKITPATIAATDLVWTSSNPAIASVSSSGVVSGNAYGNVIITASSKDGTIKDTIKVYVLLASSSSSAVSTPACSYDAYNDSLTCANPGVADLSAANIADGVNNVTITAGLGNGEISFNNLKVSGKVLINGGGSNSIIFTGSETSINEIDLAKDSSATGSQEPRLELGAGTSVNKITVVQPATVTVNTPTINEIIVKENATIGGSQTVASVSIPSDATANTTVNVTGAVTIVKNALATGVVQGTGSVATVRASAATTVNMDTVVQNMTGATINVAIQGQATNSLGANAVQEVKNSSTNTATIGDITGASSLKSAYITDGYALIDLKLYPNDRTALQTKYATLLSTLVSTPANLTDAEKSLASATDVKTYLLTGFTATPYLVSFKIDLDGSGAGAAVDYTSLISNGDGKLEVKKNLANSTETPTYEYTYMAADGTSTPVSSANFQKSSASFTVDYKVAGSFAPDSVSLTPPESLDFGSFELSYVVSDNLIYSAQTDADIAAIIAANNGNDINIISGTTSTNTVKVSIDATDDKPTYHIDCEQDIKDIQALLKLDGTALNDLASTLKLDANIDTAGLLNSGNGWTSAALTLDLNNHKLTRTSVGNTTIYVNGGAKLKIVDSSASAGGVISNTVTDGVRVINVSGSGSEVIMSSGKIEIALPDAYCVDIDEGGYFELQGGSLTSTNYLGVFIRATGSKLKVTDGSISGKDYAVSGNGSTGLGGTIIDISGGSLTATNTSDGTAIYQPQTGTLTISGGTLTGYNGIYAKAGTIDISGGTITGNGAKASPSPYGNGFNVTGDAIMLDTMKGGYVGDIHLTVTGGTIQATNATPGYAIQSVDNRDTETSKLLPTISLKDATLVGGTSFCTGSGVTLLASANDTDASVATLFGEGNSFKYSKDSNVTSIDVASDGKVTYNIDAEQDIKDVQALLKLDGSVLDALESTLKLDANIDTASLINSGNGWTSAALTLDLNNFKLTRTSATGNTTIYVHDGAKLKIADSSNAKGGVISHTGAAGATVINVSGSGSEVIMSAGKIEIALTSADCVDIYDGGYFELQGGSLASTNFLGVFIRDTGSKLKVTDGSISGKDYAVSGNGSTGLGGTIIDISGGSLTATNTSDGTAIYQPQTGTLTISGGTLTGYNGIYAKAGTINISGGTITGNGAKASPSPYGNGFNVTGDAIMLDTMKGDYVGDIHLTVTGGTIQATNANPGYAIQSVDNRDTETTKSLPTVSTVTAGATYTGGTKYCAGTTVVVS